MVAETGTPSPGIPSPKILSKQIDFDDLNRQLNDVEAKLKSLEAADYPLSSSSLFAIAESYQLLCQRYAYLSTFYPNTIHAKRAYTLVAYGRRLLYGNRLQRNKDSFLRRARKSFSRLQGYCAISSAAFILSGILVSILVTVNPSFGWNFLTEETASQLRQGKLWTEGIQGFSSIASSGIATNNIKVTFLSFALGVTGGFLTLMLMIFNGAHIGGLFATVHHYGMSHRLLDFVIAHGVLELSVIMIAGGCGLALGDALLHPGSLSRKESLQRRARPAVDLMLYSALWLVPAAIVEGYVSPYLYIPFSLKVSIGLILGFLYWASLIGYKEDGSHKTT